MPTYKLIDTKTVTSNTNTVSFTSIPDTYTDLVLWISARNAQNNYGGFFMYFNNTYSGMTYRFMRGYDTSSTQTGVQSSTVDVMQFPISGDTANTFSNAEVYITQYSSNAKTKFYRADSARITPNITSNGGSIRMANGRWDSTAVINRVDLFTDTDNFLTGSKFWLYGIKNS